MGWKHWVFRVTLVPLCTPDTFLTEETGLDFDGRVLFWRQDGVKTHDRAVFLDLG
jgi:hypothetical protein